MKRAMRRMRKTLVLVACIALVAGLAIGGTLAWLADDTQPITNTFTTAGIDIDLTETPNQDDNTWKAQLVPGMEYAKNPVVSVVRPETDVEIYLFVKFEETVDENVLSYNSTLTSINGWEPLNGVANVWYRTVGATEVTTCNNTDCEVTNPHWHLLEGDKVSIDNDVVKTDIPNADTTMKWTAYAIQTVKDKDNKLQPKEAWDILNPTTGA